MAKNKRPQGNESNKNIPEIPKENPRQEVLEERVITAEKISFWANFKMLSILIMVFSGLIYVNTLSHKYAVDDAIVITRNQFTSKGLAGMKGIWGEDTFVGFFGDNKNLVAGGRYRPFSVATFALENQLFGSVVTNKSSAAMLTIVKGKETVVQPGQPILDKDGDRNFEGNPHISHLINLLLYGFLCVLLYWLFLEMFNPTRDPDNHKANFLSFIAVMLYAAHPIHTEAVANIKGRDEILVLMGSIMALYWTLRAYNFRGNSVKSKKYIVFAILGFLMGIFSKENAITFVAIIPITMYLFTKARPFEIALYSAPYLVISLFFWFGIRNLIFLDMEKMEMAREYMNNPFMKVVKDTNGGVQYLDMGFSEKYGLIVYTWWEYFRLLLLPHPLTNDYYPMHLTYSPDGEIERSFSHPMTLFSVLFHLGLAGVFIWGFVHRHAIAFCVIFYAATFSVVSNLFFPIGTTMAERFMFLPSVGFSLACAMGLWALGEKVKNKTIPLAIFGVVMALYTIKTFVRNFAWKNDQVLFITDIEVSKNSAKLNNAVSGVYQEFLADPNNVEAQNPQKRKEIIDKALMHATRAIDMHPEYNQAWLLLGNAHVYKGDYVAATANGDTALIDTVVNAFNQAVMSYRKVISLRYDHPDAIKNMWVVYLKIANFLENQGQLYAASNPNRMYNYFGLAVGYYDQFINYLQVEYPQTYSNYPHPDIASSLGNCYRERGQSLGRRLNQLDMSIESLERAAVYLPRDANIPRLLGVANGIKGDHKRAVEYFEKALVMGGDNIAIFFNLEKAYELLVQQAKTQGVDAATILQYEEKQKYYRGKWFAMDPNYNPAKG